MRVSYDYLDHKVWYLRVSVSLFRGLGRIGLGFRGLGYSMITWITKFVLFFFFLGGVRVYKV